MVPELGLALRLASGRMRGVRKVQLQGRNAAISTSVETIWTPGAAYAQLTTAVAFEAVSSNAADAAAGTGARTIQADLVDGNGLQTTVTVALNGATPVAISGTYIACNGARVFTAGSGLVNAGTVDIRTVSGSVVKRRIDTGNGIDQDFVYTIPTQITDTKNQIASNTTPKGMIGILGSITYGISNSTGNFRGWIKTQSSTGIINLINHSIPGLNYPNILDCGVGVKLESGTLLSFEGIESAGAGEICAMADLYLITIGDNGLVV